MTQTFNKIVRDATLSSEALLRQFFGVLAQLFDQKLGVETRKTFGEFFIGDSLAQGGLDHALLGVKVIDKRDKNRLGGGRQDGGTPFEFTLVAGNNVLQAFEPVGIEFRFEAGLACELIT